MSDLISRRQAIDALGDEPEVWSGKDEYAQGLNNQWHYDRNAIKALPSAQPEQRWIPVTERLPGEDDYGQCYGYEDGAVWWCNDMGLIGLGWHYPSTGKWAYYDESDRCEKGVGNVIAWMPLPEPYKAERREK